MLLRINHPELPLQQYASVLPPQLMDDLTTLAEQFQGMRFVHANSTATGGGVAEILQSLVPFMNSLGLATERIVVSPEDSKFFQVTKRIHNLLQGSSGSLSQEELEVYFKCSEQVAEDIRSRELQADVWFLHDPQLLPLAMQLPKTNGELRLWVCHIDLTAPNAETLEALAPLTSYYDGLAFSLDEFVPDGITGHYPVYITPPSIDPLTDKNTSMTEEEVLAIVSAMGIDTERPLVCQVSRFDYWKDPWGVIDAFRQARESVPGIQLALLGLSQAADDPEALGVLHSVKEYAAGDPDIHAYFYPDDLPDSIDRIVNAFQTASAVILQKSTREGFGLTVSEAMWKGQPVIGGNVGGIRTQIEDGVCGFLVNNPQECGERIVQLMQDESRRKDMGRAAQERIREKFLLPRLALDYLKAVRSLLPLSATLEHSSNGNGKGKTDPFDALEQLNLNGIK
ncbi:MAG: glycosyltransferase [Chloroflexi bacterium]|nr:glycosyltransferase [Chloroflexota bacterium]